MRWRDEAAGAVYEAGEMTTAPESEKRPSGLAAMILGIGELEGLGAAPGGGAGMRASRRSQGRLL